MEIYKCNKRNTKWYKKRDYIELVIVSVITFVISLLFFNYIGNDFERALVTSLYITLLIIFYNVTKSLIENRDAIYLIENKKIRYIDIQKGRDGSLLTNIEYKEILDANKPKDIYNNNEKFEGITTGEIVKVLKVKKSINKTKVSAMVKGKKWQIKGIFRINKTELIESEFKKKFIITKDYDNYEELIKLFTT
jgi:hypothetical protein